MLVLRSGVVFLACSAFLAGCSGGGGTPAPNRTASPTATPVPTATPTPSPAVTISVSASTNRNAYTIVLQTSGSAAFSQDGYGTTTTVSSTDTAQLFTDLNANLPVSNVATMPNCTKDVSFGTTTMLTYEGSTSGDISCPPSTTSPAAMLNTDVKNVESDMMANGISFTH